MERLCVLWLPGLQHEGLEGAEARAFAEAMELIEERCPFVEPIRQGLCAWPARAPARFFGGEAAVIELLRQDLAELAAELGGGLRAGVADGLFAAVQAARADLLIPTGETADFLAPLPVSTLRRPELASQLERLGLRSLGRFAALEHARVLERFGTDGAHCRRVAAGEEGELGGLRDPRIARRLAGLDDDAAPPAQPSFFGGASAADERARRAAVLLQRRLGTEAVRMAQAREGHDPHERAALVPFGSGIAAVGADGPWPGSLPAPSPARVPAHATILELLDAEGAAVRVGGRGRLSAVPDRVLLEGRGQRIVAWGGPWPLWGGLLGRRRRARLQLLTEQGVGLLVGTGPAGWQLLGVYD